MKIFKIDYSAVAPGALNATLFMVEDNLQNVRRHVKLNYAEPHQVQICQLSAQEVRTSTDKEVIALRSQYPIAGVR